PSSRSRRPHPAPARCMSCLDRLRPSTDVHSFPTRRSSDLQVSVGLVVEGRFAGRVGAVARRDEDHHSLAGASQKNAVGVELISLDRKSTRLNSSHSQISYAVFCLKIKMGKTLCKAGAT